MELRPTLPTGMPFPAPPGHRTLIFRGGRYLALGGANAYPEASPAGFGGAGFHWVPRMELGGEQRALCGSRAVSLDYNGFDP